MTCSFSTKHSVAAASLLLLTTATASAQDATIAVAPTPSQLVVCDPKDMARAMETLQPAVARVAAPMWTGLGVVFRDRWHLLTAFTLVENGRGIEVTFEGHETIGARVVAVDEEHDLALLEMDAPADVDPPALAQKALGVGDPVLAAGLAFTWDHPDLVLTGGIVNGLTGERLHTSALDSRNMAFGGPLVDCSGAIVAIATDPWTDEAATLDALRPLEERPPSAEVYSSGWSLLHPSVGMVVQVDGDREEPWLGISLGTALIGDDEWYLPFRASAFALITPEDPEATEQVAGVRLQFETGIGYRAMLVGGEFPVYLVPQIGVAARWQQLLTTRTFLSLDGCSPGEPCDIADETVEERDSSWRISPTLGLGLQFAFGEVSYQFQLDVDNPQASTHQMFIGFQF
jgi:S1-C subfamily serine protease